MSDLGGWAFVVALLAGPILVYAGGARLVFGKPWSKLHRHENGAFGILLTLVGVLAYGGYRLVIWLL